MKKIIEAEVAEKKQSNGNNDVIVETPPSKTELSSVHEPHLGWNTVMTICNTPIGKVPFKRH